MQIRRATIEDAAILSNLNLEIQLLHAQALPDIFKTPESGDFALQFMGDQLSSPDNYFFIANLAGEDIGYVFARLIDRPENPFMYAWKYLHIDHIMVSSAHQGKGIGTQLMIKLRQLARELGIKTIILDTWAFNKQAQAFFARQGFTPFNHHLWLQEAIP